MSSAFRCQEFLRPRGSAVLRDALPRPARLAVRHMQQAGDRSMRDGNVSQVPPRTLRLHLLPATAQQGHVQGTEQQALLPAVFPATFQLMSFILPSLLSTECQCVLCIHIQAISSLWFYEGHPKSFRPRHIRQQYFPQSIHQWNVHPLRTLMSRLWIWRRYNLWRHRALNRSDFQRQ